MSRIVKSSAFNLIKNLEMEPIELTLKPCKHTSKRVLATLQPQRLQRRQHRGVAHTGVR